MKDLRGTLNLDPNFNPVGLCPKLSLILIKKDGSKVDYGVVGRKKITNYFASMLVGAMQAETLPGEQIRSILWHSSGTGTTAEDQTDTEVETAVPPTTTIPQAGTSEETSAAVYKSIATLVYADTHNITEHGIFCTDGVLDGSLIDRTVFGAVSVVSGDSIRFTYELTIVAGN